MDTKITVVYPKKEGTIAPELYGHFTEHIGGVFYDGLWVGKDSDIPNIDGFRKDIVEKLKKIKPAVLRWPGGCFAETYRWRDGIGENRPVRPAWWTRYDGRYESNEVGTHEFLRLCELVGAKAYFAVNVTSITPMEAREWMDYCLSPKGSTTLALEREKNGHPEPFDISYLGVGNENWGGGGNMTPDYYALEYRRFATVLRNLCVDKTELILGGANASDFAWTHGIAKNLSESITPVNGMSFHFYCGPAGDAVDFTEDDWNDLMKSAKRMEALIRRHYAITESYGVDDKFKLVIDEWGCWHPEGSGPSKGKNLYEQQSTMRDAVVSALTLNIFNHHCAKIKMANAAQLCNNLHALFLAGGDACIATPTYHVFDLFQGHQGAECLQTVVGCEELSVSASEKDGSILVTVANLSCTEDALVDIDLLGWQGTAVSVKTATLAADDIHAHNSFEEPEKVVPVYETVDVGAKIRVPHASVVAVTYTLAESTAEV